MFFMTKLPCNRDEVLDELRRIYSLIEPQIQQRIAEFKHICVHGTEEQVFAEFVFCLFTPQSNARSCWGAVERLTAKGLLVRGTKPQLAREMSGVRFHHTKAKNLIRARALFVVDDSIILKSLISAFSDVHYMREWLVANVKGLGYKEASHFLRNIGYGLDLAILDRHVLRNLCLCGSIDTIPETLPRQEYYRLERCMLELAADANIPMSHLDFVLFYRQTKDIFK